jgi:hypothetical protein
VLYFWKKWALQPSSGQMWHIHFHCTQILTLSYVRMFKNRKDPVFVIRFSKYLRIVSKFRFTTFHQKEKSSSR